MKRKILIVEDNIGLSQMQKDWFAQAGYDAVTAMNEPVARSLIRKTAFDLILSDVRLPEGDGISLLEWLRKERKDIPFIITTEYVSVSDVVRTIKLGAIDYPSRCARNTCWNWQRMYSAPWSRCGNRRRHCFTGQVRRFCKWRS